ncbi:ATP-binding protein [Algoriphagus chordae]|uniref:Histidine kinase/DNA gyrase B/HSP90-like ATPase n=1 Tax=Algoriphagus chordae TaxID=237019 RepID=A0A2W7QZQ7_9BACT|nr:ATP-binding protein [Algoriphagus chordae]PZX54033.1 histidine kinase/DNA gyrase B/HSP90-like ATPase [Algoriphagus chordae]
MSIELEIDPGRILFGLSRIGYTTSSAICDIIDNSIRANAKFVKLVIIKERKDFSDAKKNNISEYIIADDGDGMDREGILNALMLGSSDKLYEEHSLSKFGLGLKSASFSQGDILEIVSSKDGEFNKFRVSLPEIMQTNKYSATEEEISKADRDLIEKYLKENKGTLIRISGIRKNNHPSVKNTIAELNTKVGVIYYYFIKETGLEIFIGDTKVVGIDPLFVEEANISGNLDENVWDGTDVRWIEKNKTIVLDNDLNITAELEVTQLPYPPIFRIKNLGEAKDAEIRKKYLIESPNYGFYVYRNKRLISWASHLNGIIPYDQDYYAFRGRISIDNLADDFFNIDVKKSTLTLSEEAWKVISDVTREARSKSQNAWKNANRLRNEIINKDPNEIANKLLEEFEQIEILPGDILPTEEEVERRLEMITSDMASKVRLIVKMMREDKGEEATDQDDISEEEKEEAIKGEINPTLSKIFRVSSVQDNLLWEPYYDTDLGNCVRINKLHRFGIYIYESNLSNKDMQITFDLLMLQLSDSEFYAYKNVTEFDYEQLKSVLWNFRRIISEFLANMVRKLENELPPNYKGVE